MAMITISGRHRRRAQLRHPACIVSQCNSTQEHRCGILRWPCASSQITQHSFSVALISSKPLSAFRSMLVGAHNARMECNFCFDLISGKNAVTACASRPADNVLFRKWTRRARSIVCVCVIFRCVTFIPECAKRTTKMCCKKNEDDTKCLSEFERSHPSNVSTQPEYESGNTQRMAIATIADWCLTRRAWRRVHTLSLTPACGNLFIFLSIQWRWMHCATLSQRNRTVISSEIFCRVIPFHNSAVCVCACAYRTDGIGTL